MGKVKGPSLSTLEELILERNPGITEIKALLIEVEAIVAKCQKSVADAEKNLAASKFTLDEALDLESRVKASLEQYDGSIDDGLSGLFML